MLCTRTLCFRITDGAQFPDLRMCRPISQVNIVKPRVQERVATSFYTYYLVIKQFTGNISNSNQHQVRRIKVEKLHRDFNLPINDIALVFVDESDR